MPNRLPAGSDKGDGQVGSLWAATLLASILRADVLPRGTRFSRAHLGKESESTAAMGTVVTFPQSRDALRRRLAILENCIRLSRESILQEHKRIQTLAGFGYDASHAINCLRGLHDRLELYVAERNRLRKALENESAAPASEQLA